RNAEALAQIQRLRDYTTICGSRPAEQLALHAIGAADALEQRCRDIVHDNLALAADTLARHDDRLQWLAPDAGPVAFPRLRAESAEAFCEQARARFGVLLAPARLFGYGDAHIRIGLGRRDFHRGLAALEAFVDASRASAR
nr:aminotransferase [Deltaproteobacteria bacterium]